MNKQSYLYIGIACSIATLAIIQCVIPEMLPINLYIDISWISLELTMLEVLKSTIQAYLKSKKRIADVVNSEINNCNRLLAVFKNSPELSYDYKRYTEMKANLTIQLDKINKRKRDKNLIRIEKVVTLFQVIVCFVQFPLMLVKKIPNDLQSNKLVGVLGLISFALLIVSYFISFRSEDDMNYIDEKIRTSNDFNEYYISLFEKAMINKHNNES